MTTKLPDTSIEAYESVSVEMLADHHRKIVNALSVLGNANYEKIATLMGMEPHAVGRRLKELLEMELIYKTENKSLTKSGRKAYDYCLTGRGMPKTDEQVKEAYNNIKVEASENETFTTYKQQSMF